MSIFYKLYKDTRKKKGTEEPLNAKTFGKWFARAVTTGTIESRELAEKIAYSASATVADTLSVINALVKVMSDSLKEGYTVKLDGFGAWKIAIKTTGATEADAFSVTKNITGARVNFMPEYTIDHTTGKKNTKMVAGAKVKETAKNDR